MALWPTLQPLVKGSGEYGKVTLSELTGTSPWVWIAGLVAVGLIGAGVLRGLAGPGTRSVLDGTVPLPSQTGM